MTGTILLVDIYAAAIATGTKPATLRKRLERGKLTRHGYDADGRALVNLTELESLKASLTVQ